MWKLRNSFRLAFASPDLVILDLDQDRFSIIPDADLESLNAGLDGTIRSEVIDYLVEIGALCEGTPALKLSNNNSQGMFEERFMTPLPAAGAVPLATKIGSYLELIRSSVWIRRSRLGVILAAMERARTGTRGKKVRVEALNTTLSKAFVIDVSGNRCLTYSYTLARLAKAHSIAARLVIGVRTRPFFSHAWVEVGGRVVNDDPELRSKLAVIAEA